MLSGRAISNKIKDCSVTSCMLQGILNGKIPYCDRNKSQIQTNSK